MSTKSKSIETKTDFNQDERLKKVSKLRLLLNRPELGALGGAILVFIFFGIVAVNGSFYVQTGVFLPDVFVLSFIPGFLASNILNV